MKTIAAIEVDLERSPLGTRSRLATELAGRPVLRRTIERIRRAQRLASIFVVTPVTQQNRVAELIAGLDIPMETHAAGAPAWRGLVRSARKWAIDAWRGGVGSLCAFDEHTHPGILAALGRREGADAVASIPAAAILFDPQLLDEMIVHFEGESEDTRIVFCQAPPGLSALLARPSILEELHQVGHPLGALMNYVPDRPQFDLTSRSCCHLVPSILSETSQRFLADTQRGIDMLAEILGEHDEQTLNAVRLCELDAVRKAGHVDRLPREVEIELTTEDQQPQTTLRPRGQRVPPRGPIDVSLVGWIASQVAQYDDALLFLGGFGEPLLHPDLRGVLAACRQAGVFGLALRTNGLALDEAMIDLMSEFAVDTVIVTVDAYLPETYRALNGTDGLEIVVPNIDAMVARSRQRRDCPLIVPEMAKIRQTLPEQEAFFDHWFRRAGWANVVTPSHYAGQMPNQAVVNTAPPQRGRCGRLWSRMMVLADGTVVTCDQDFAARQPVGNARDQSLQEIWTGPAPTDLREAHTQSELTHLPLCPHCDEWHRT